ncbi:hypothetical protein [Psychrobacter urativorans]|uniref:DUF3828 domain-containing protein n=1 Tax=Psychrobacter urativorans TaxID=45610 RepID=A0A0M4SW22_9GAMM|nr:hypothetical protein [Psychrobacter urativorans]ALF58910.1 hypothetical protein AOC03_01635 [Psychrobacter urativorans]
MKPIPLFIVLLVLGLTTRVAIADNVATKQAVSVADSQTQKIATIKKMYQQDIDNEGQDYPVVLQQYASKDLQAAMQREQDYFKREQTSCNIGYDVLWDSQDPDYEQEKQFSVTEQGLVQVSLAQGSIVNYELACDDKECLVHDMIVDKNGTSLKKYLNEACQ